MGARVAGGGSSWRGFAANLSIRVKLAGTTGLLILLAATIGAVGIDGMSAVQQRTEQLYTNGVVPLGHLADLHNGELKVRSVMFGYATTRDSPHRATWTDSIKQADGEVTDALAAYQPYVSGERATTLAAFEASWTRFLAVRDQSLVPEVNRGDYVAFWHDYDTEAKPAISDSADALDELQVLENARGQTANAAAHRVTRSRTRWAIGLILAALIFGLALAWRLGRAILVPLRQVSRVVAGLSRGDLTQATLVTTDDEIGQMAQALDLATMGLRETVGGLTGYSTSVASASEQLTEVASELAQAAQETSSRAIAMTTALEQVSQHIHNVAAGTEQMTASIQEIGRSASEAARAGGDAVELATTTTEAVSRLGDSSSEIGNVVKVITSIAEQTNLLALNATIEAARAGEAGKGFAVVAEEVKELSQGTARATEEIGRRVEAIQADTAHAISAISKIAAVIGHLNAYQTTIAAAVEEQAATSAEMGRSVAEAAGGASEILGTANTVATAAETTSITVQRAENTSTDLAHTAAELRQVSDGFITHTK